MKEQLLKFNKFTDTYPVVIVSIIIGILGAAFGVYYGSTFSMVVGAFIIAYNCARIIYKVNNEEPKQVSEDVANDLMDRLKGKPVELDAYGLFKFIRDNDQCPDCRVKPLRLLEGPSGGLSTNVQCGDCGNWFNITPGIECLERIRR